MLLDDIATVLIANSVASSSGEGGWYLWKSHLPDSTYIANLAVAIIETGGYAPDASVELARPTFQLLTRGRSIMQVSTAYEEARAKAQEANDALHAYTPGQINEHHYVGIWAEQDAFFAGLDEGDRPMFSQNFRVQRSWGKTPHILVETGDALLQETGDYLQLDEA